MQNEHSPQHLPVLLNQVVQALNIRADGKYIDCTFGRGGHSRAILNNLDSDGRLLALDQDAEAIEFGRKKFCNDKRVQFVQKNFSELSQVVSEFNFMGEANGILFDLGVSSPQLDDPTRGFSFTHDGPLDMRMNNQVGLPASEWLQQVSEYELERVVKEYGQERYAKKIAKAVIAQQKKNPIVTTAQLAGLIQKTLGRSDEKKHPATRTFQAIRIFINKELDSLTATLEDCLNVLSISGRLLVITFHSLEDRIVKNYFKKHSQSNLPRKLPIMDDYVATLKRVCKPITPSDEEIAQNIRSRSAKLHVLEKIA